jgi:hypothetical protein
LGGIPQKKKKKKIKKKKKKKYFIIFYFYSKNVYPYPGAEPHYGLGGLGPPQAKGLPQKKKKNLKKKRKNIIFTPIL